MRVAGSTVVALLLLATTAQASTLSAQLFSVMESPGTYTTHTAYTFKGVAAEQNDFTFRQASVLYPIPSIDTITDGLNLITSVPGPSLGAGGIGLVCTPTLLVIACVNGSGATHLNAQLGNGNDRGIAYTVGVFDATWDGGAGNDATGGGETNDFNYAGPGADRLLGGRGTDTADYSARTTRVEITLDGAANDGGAGESDYVAPDVERLFVGSGGSRVVGSPATLKVLGGAGNDEYIGAATPNAGTFIIEVRGEGGNDTFTGGSGRDVLNGGDGDDVLVGGLGDDPLDGGPGDDELDGGPGIDFIYTGTGTDVVYAGDGNDQVSLGAGAQTVDAGAGDDYVGMTADGVVDNITCGPGNDRVRGSSDPFDVIAADCEDVA
jgi:Ca2+-binding RTX toxin-like protein